MFCREDTLNRWFSTVTDYTKSVEGKLPGIQPDPSKCPEFVHKPPCDSNPRIFTDYNGCLFFICDQPPSSGKQIKKKTQLSVVVLRILQCKFWV